VTDLAWEQAGEGPPDILLLHPGLCDRTFWDPVWYAVASLGRAIRFDARAFGASPDPDGSWSPADDAAAVLDAAGSERAVVVGVSFGSRTALDLAVGWPERVCGLVLVSGPGDEDAALEEQFEAIDDAIDRGDLDAANVMEVQLWAAHAKDEVRAWVTAQNRAVLERQAAIEHEPVFAEPPAAELAGDLAMPVLVLLGEHDTPQTVAGAQEVARRAGAQVVVIPGAGHLLGREEPDAFLAALEPFVRAASP
jgi:pimeloyl-ACP methyl ester carboxylesterase